MSVTHESMRQAYLDATSGEDIPDLVWFPGVEALRAFEREHGLPPMPVEENI